MNVRIKINNYYDFTDDVFMSVFNQEIKQYTDNFGWSYNPETKELDLNVPEDFRTDLLLKFGDIIPDATKEGLKIE